MDNTNPIIVDEELRTRIAQMEETILNLYDQYVQDCVYDPNYPDPSLEKARKNLRSKLNALQEDGHSLKEKIDTFFEQYNKIRSSLKEFPETFRAYGCARLNYDQIILILQSEELNQLRNL